MGNKDKMKRLKGFINEIKFEGIITNREDYEADLRKRQREHLDKVRGTTDKDWIPCAHNSCRECIGTGMKKNGSLCLHGLVCYCSRCSFLMNDTKINAEDLLEGLDDEDN